MWLATCDSESCGRITVPLSQKEELAEFFGVQTRPLAHPWTRLFLEAAAVEGLRWRTAGTTCPGCGVCDFFFWTFFYPVTNPYEALLCIGCGTTITRHVVDGTASEVHGGDDWATPDEAVRNLRGAVRTRSSVEEGERDVWDFGP